MERPWSPHDWYTSTKILFVGHSHLECMIYTVDLTFSHMANLTFKFKTSADYKLNIGANELELSDRVLEYRVFWLPAFSLIPPIFSKDFCPRVVKTRESLVKN